jgi:hypothetical protein
MLSFRPVIMYMHTMKTRDVTSKEVATSDQLSSVMGADNGPKSVNRCEPVGVLQSNLDPGTLDGGTGKATAAAVVATTVDQCFFDDDPARKNWSPSCGFSLLYAVRLPS